MIPETELRRIEQSMEPGLRDTGLTCEEWCKKNPPPKCACKEQCRCDPVFRWIRRRDLLYPPSPKIHGCTAQKLIDEIRRLRKLAGEE